MAKNNDPLPRVIGYLASHIVSPSDELPPVWPHALGEHRGLALAPLHGSAVEASRRDPQLAERLALLDALRIGGQRVRGVAAELLIPRLTPSEVVGSAGNL